MLHCHHHSGSSSNNAAIRGNIGPCRRVAITKAVCATGSSGHQARAAYCNMLQSHHHRKSSGSSTATHNQTMHAATTTERRVAAVIKQVRHTVCCSPTTALGLQQLKHCITKHNHASCEGSQTQPKKRHAVVAQTCSHELPEKLVTCTDTFAQKRHFLLSRSVSRIPVLMGSGTLSLIPP
jgi:hypothetical protein